MPVLLHLETTTHQCAVALSKNGEVLSNRCVRDDGYSHAERLQPFIDEVFTESGLDREELQGVSVSSGPGSYTGLRIGVATAKGICHALGIPLISIDTLTVLALQAIKKYPGLELYVPMIDARRMEVYSRSFNSEGDSLTQVEAIVIEPDSKDDFFWNEYTRICFSGDGALKFSDLLEGRNRVFFEDWPTATASVGLALKAFNESRFENLALYEPYYLKTFKAGKAKDPLGLRQ